MTTVKKVATYIRKLQVEKGYDVPIAITGMEQAGKSTGAMQIGRELQGGLDLERNIGYTILECSEKIQALDMYDWFNSDEAIRAMYKRDFASPENKELIKQFAQVGYKRCAFFFSIPNFWDLDPFYRNHRVKIWIHVVDKEMDEKGRPVQFHAVVFRKDWNPFISDPWHQKENQKITGKVFMNMFTPVEKKVRTLSRTNIYMGYFRYPPLPDKIWEKYKKISEERKKQSLVGQMATRDVLLFNTLLYNLNHRRNFSSRELEALLVHPARPESKPFMTYRQIQNRIKRYMDIY